MRTLCHLTPPEGGGTCEPVDNRVVGPGSGMHDVRVTRLLGHDRAPAATRSTPPGWRDPRLWVGLAIVTGSVVVGARVLGASDDTTAVWAVADDLGTGDEVAAADLTAREVRFADPADIERYLPATEALPSEVRLARGVGEGELLPRAALEPAAQAGIVEVPLALDAGRVPVSVRSGSVVDVWVTADPARATSRAAEATLVLDAVVVLDAPPADEGFGAVGDRQLVVGVPPDQAGRLAQALAAAVTGGLVVTRQG